jgi:hypothetical protein
MSNPIVTVEGFALGNIIRSAKIRGYLYDAGIAIGLGITAANAGVAYLLGAGAIEGYPLWLGTASAVYAVLAPGLFGVAKSNTPI